MYTICRINSAHMQPYFAFLFSFFLLLGYIDIVSSQLVGFFSREHAWHIRIVRMSPYVLWHFENSIHWQSIFARHHDAYAGLKETGNKNMFIKANVTIRTFLHFPKVPLWTLFYVSQCLFWRKQQLLEMFNCFVIWFANSVMNRKKFKSKLCEIVRHKRHIQISWCLVY